MKTYYNGQRQGMSYGGGANMRKPMMYGGIAQKNRTTNQSGMGMTDEKRFNMGMNLGVAIKKFEKKSHGGKLTGKKKELAAMYGNPNEITRGDIITAAKEKKNGKKTT